VEKNRKKFLYWANLPEEQASKYYDLLSRTEQKKLDAFIFVAGTSPSGALRDLEKKVTKGEMEYVFELIDKLPKKELLKLVKTGLKRGTLYKNIDKLEKIELQELVESCVFPKSFLVYLAFKKGLDKKRMRYLGLSDDE
jgi:hypothetical protein